MSFNLFIFENIVPFIELIERQFVSLKQNTNYEVSQCSHLKIDVKSDVNPNKVGDTVKPALATTCIERPRVYMYMYKDHILFP